MKGLPSISRMERNYERAIELLYAKGRQGRPTAAHTAHLEGLPESANTIARATVKGKPSIYGLKEWLSELGHSPSDINNLNIIHVAGTKGKGSTCTFTSSFLAAHGQRTGFPRKIGLYTSPHLIHTEERIRINFQPISRDLFAKYYFEVEDLLSRPNPEKFHIRPRTLQVLTLLAFHVFIREGVDVAVFETHHGGEYDSTNVVEQPVVTAITSLGIDHINSLGPDLSSIAWHKGGIFKTGSVALSAPQDPEAADALRGRAREKGVELQFVNHVSELEDWDLPKDILQLKPDVQRVNASVALAATRAWLQAKCSPPDSHISSEDILRGVQEFSWPGRFQFENEEGEKVQWFLDGAHNEMSVGKAAGWYREAADIKRTSDTAVKVLIYSSITVIRDAGAVFKELTTALVGSGINHVIFTTYDTGSSTVQLDAEKAPVGEDQHEKYAQIWKETHLDSNLFFEPTIQGALLRARDIGKEHGGMQVLITGSLHLVGGALALNLLRP